MSLPIEHGTPVYDVAGMPAFGHPTPFDKLTLDGGGTPDATTVVFQAGKSYEITSDVDFCYLLAASSPVADNADNFLGAKIPRIITPTTDVLMSAIDLGDAGSVWISSLARYGE